MLVGETGLPEPIFTSSICIGCGACHHACPVRPARAISVSGLAVHALADSPSPELFDTSPKSLAVPGTAAEGKNGAKGPDAFPF